MHEMMRAVGQPPVEKRLRRRDEVATVNICIELAAVVDVADGHHDVCRSVDLALAGKLATLHANVSKRLRDVVEAGDWSFQCRPLPFSLSTIKTSSTTPPFWPQTPAGRPISSSAESYWTHITRPGLLQGYVRPLALLTKSTTPSAS
jgi:hypothetical protein